MLPQRTPKAFVEPNAVLPEGGLIVVHDTGKGNGILHECPILSTLGAILPVGEERQPAPGDPASLFSNELIGAPASGKRHPAHPGLHGSPQLYLGRVCPYGF